MSKKFYSLLLLLYPESHRARFGAEMLQAFEDARSEAAERGALLGFWIRIIGDAARSASAERAAELQSNHIHYMNTAFLTPTIGKVILAVIGTFPLFWVALLAFVGLSMRLPHPHVNGFGALLAMSIVFIVPTLASAAVSYVCSSAIVSAFTRPRTA